MRPSRTHPHSVLDELTEAEAQLQRLRATLKAIVIVARHDAGSSTINHRVTLFSIADKAAAELEGAG